ncbi:hypothetical protein MPSI1_003528 [Malassezia psittaci]|uniref:Protection of telomeres protein 1 n=1 Tax=Malassezia psittaci TaxID=1821823 RepID=A0AAF0FHY5_9BASI|nr:hypothetical protein MPSI1_003528 [Malassezia psittaci]
MGRLRRKTRRASSVDFVPREASSYAYPIPRKLPNFAIHIMGLPHPECEQLTYDVSEKALLGDSVSIDVWMEMVSQGRGASVCVAGNLTRLSSVAGNPATFGCVFEAQRSEDDVHIPLFFTGRNVEALHTFISSNHAGNTPVFLSGFGAETQRFGTIEAPRTRVIYTQNRIALKAYVLNDTEASDPVPYTVWFESNKDAPVTQVMLPMTNTDNLSPNSEAWLRTPDARQSTPANANMLQFTPQASKPSELPFQKPLSITPFSNAAETHSREPQQDVMPTAYRLPSPSPAQEQTVSQRLYTPIASLRKDMIANVMGMAISDANIRLPVQQHRDVMVKLTLTDGSGSDESASTLSSNLFAMNEEDLPGAVSEKDAVILRQVQIGIFNGRKQGVGSRKAPFQWAAWNHTTNTWRYAANATAQDFTDAERNALLRLVAHLSNGPSLGKKDLAVSNNVRALTTISSLQPHTFVDLVGEVVKVFSQSDPPDLYITDYTTHKNIYDGNNKHLPTQPPPDCIGGSVLQVGLWGLHAPLAMQLRTGQLVRLDNMRIRENPRTGLLTGALGSDKRIQIAPVDEDHTAVRALLARKSAWEKSVSEKKRAIPPSTPTPLRKRPAPEPVYQPRFDLDESEPFAALDTLWSPS